MVTGGLGWTGVGFTLALLGAAARAQSPPSDHSMGELSTAVRADVKGEVTIVQAGRPVWVEFALINLTAESLSLRAPKASPAEAPAGEMGLPIGHVFSGTGFTALTATDSYGDPVDKQVSLPPEDGVSPVRLCPFGSVGLRLELTQYYHSLRRPGKYTLLWQPYEGALKSAPFTLIVLAEREAVINTDYGKMTMRFYYDQAPYHVQNFVELVEQSFYYNLTFHRVVPGGIIQGGDPRGDGYGIRPDGKRLKAEFSDIPFELGTVGMARSQHDPDSASCQFFICLARQPAFDGHQTALGHLVGNESFETLRRLAALPTGEKDRPRKPIYIRSISLASVPTRDRAQALIQNQRAGSELRASQPAATAPSSEALLDPDQPLLPSAPGPTPRPGQVRERRALWKGRASTQPADRPNG